MVKFSVYLNRHVFVMDAPSIRRYTYATLPHSWAVYPSLAHRGNFACCCDKAFLSFFLLCSSFQLLPRWEFMTHNISGVDYSFCLFCFNKCTRIWYQNFSNMFVLLECLLDTLHITERFCFPWVICAYVSN